MTVTSYSRWTWIVALILVVALAILWAIGHGPIGACCGNEDGAATSTAAPPALTPSPPMQSTAKAPGTFAVHIDGDKRVIEGTVTDEQAKQRVMQAASAAFAASDLVDRLAVDATIATSRCAQKADALFPALETDPPVAIERDAKGGVTLRGTALSDTDKAARERWAHDFFGADATITNAIEVAAAAPLATRPEDVHCAARMPAAVTFRTASSRIDGKGRALLDAIVPCLKTGKYEVAGYTDNVGTDADNLKLSQSRAESVRAYMILKGVEADRLFAAGYGAERPLGDNATSAGRASNRRIEFVKK
ncbi:MAG: OmpA family protein [Rhodanobacteraceae bacterium]